LRVEEALQTRFLVVFRDDIDHAAIDAACHCHLIVPVAEPLFARWLAGWRRDVPSCDTLRSGHSTRRGVVVDVFI
jgi:hypothetical protein